MGLLYQHLRLSRNMRCFNNYVTLKLPFLTHRSPAIHHVLLRLFTRNLLLYVTLRTNSPFALRHAQNKQPQSPSLPIEKRTFRI